MPDATLTEQISDVQMLYDYSLSASTAATAYIAMATKSRDRQVRKLFLNMSKAAAKSAFGANDLIAKIGGEV